MYNIFVNIDVIDEMLNIRNMTAEEFCKSENYYYNAFQKIYNNDLSVTLRDLIRFAITFQIDMQELLII